MSVKISINILMVEDSDIDFEVTERALLKAGMKKENLSRCCDGDEALDFLYRRGDFENNERVFRPGIILLDLNMPGTDGREVLNEIKTDENLKDIPVLILTTSTDERDIESCYKMGANTYIQKPVNFSGFMEAVQRIKDFWVEVAILTKGK
ncbi:MAG: response regulator [Nitrospina sp.]|nr:response regulator [Nitrospina sp.]